MVKEIGDSEFEKEVLKKSEEVPVLVDFYAEWCAPCKMLTPILEKIAEEYNGKLSVVKMNVDKNPMIAALFRIFSIPAVKVFKNGKVVGEFVGAYPEEAVRDWIEKILR